MPPQKYKTGYELVDAVPEGLRWKPTTGRSKREMTLLSSPGGFYKTVRSLETGAVQYFKKVGCDTPASPKEVIDAEPAKGPQLRFPKGCVCWFVTPAGVWYACEVVDRKQDPGRLTLHSVTGWDANRLVAWPFNDDLEIEAKSALFRRLRPLKAKAR